MDENRWHFAPKGMKIVDIRPNGRPGLDVFMYRIIEDGTIWVMEVITDEFEKTYVELAEYDPTKKTGLIVSRDF